MSKGSESGRRRAPARIVIALATAALAGLAAPLIARASSPTVALNVALEYAASGAVSSSTWTPVQVTLTNSGPDFGGTVEISVTGSRVRRKDLTTPAPVTVISRDQMVTSGRVSLGQLGEGTFTGTKQ